MWRGDHFTAARQLRTSEIGPQLSAGYLRPLARTRPAALGQRVWLLRVELRPSTISAATCGRSVLHSIADVDRCLPANTRPHDLTQSLRVQAK